MWCRISGHLSDGSRHLASCRPYNASLSLHSPPHSVVYKQVHLYCIGTIAAMQYKMRIRCCHEPEHVLSVPFLYISPHIQISASLLINDQAISIFVAPQTDERALLHFLRLSPLFNCFVPPTFPQSFSNPFSFPALALIPPIELTMSSLSKQRWLLSSQKCFQSLTAEI